MAYPAGGGDTRIKLISSGSMSQPKVGDIINAKLGKNITAGGFTVLYNKGAGFVTMTTALPYTLVAADIPPIGGSYPIYVAAADLGLRSDTTNFTNPASVPGAPTIGTATAGNLTVTAPYTAPASNGGSAISSYDAFLSDANGVVAMLSNVPNPAVFTAAQGVVAGNTYTVRVRANNLVGSGPLSAASNAVTPTAAPVTQDYDIVVYGAGWPGVESALAIKEVDPTMRVLLIDFRDTPGGHTGGAIQFTDAHSNNTGLWTLPRSTKYRQMFEQLAVTFGIPLNTYFQKRSFAAESKAIRAVTNQMLADAGIVPVMAKELLSVSKTGSSSVSATFGGGVGTVTAKQWLDMSYTMDLARLSGVTLFVGGEAASAYNETAQSAGFVTAGGQPANNVDPYIIQGDSSSGLLPNINAGALPAAGSQVLNRVQYPGHRISVTNNAGKKRIYTDAQGNTVPFPLPADVDPGGDYTKWGSYAMFELHRRDALVNKQSATIASFFNFQADFPAIPSTTSGMTNKRDGNNAGIFSLDFPFAAMSFEYLTATYARRKEIEAFAKQYTLGYQYFVLKDPAVPAAVRSEFANYGYPNDDYDTTDGFPPEWYLREPGRMVGNVISSAGTISALNTLNNPCCLAMYAYDKHPRGLWVSTSGGVPHVIQEGQTPSNVAQAALGARIPATILNPKDTECDNLQSATGPSGTQMFFNSYRIEGTMACAARYAAIRAVLAIKTNVKVQAVPHADVAKLHNLFGLDNPGALTVTSDNTTRTDGTFTYEGDFAMTSNILMGTTGYYVSSATTGTNRFTCTPNITVAGNYLVHFKYVDSGSIDRGTITTVVTAGGVAQAGMTIDQNSKNGDTVLTNGDWQPLGTFAFAAGDGANNKVVGTSANNGKQANVVAMRFTKI